VERSRVRVQLPLPSVAAQAASGRMVP
jgi:hypothetical protein